MRLGGAPLLLRDDGGEDGCAAGAVLGTSWHGLLEDDRYRGALLRWVARRRSLSFEPAGVSFAAVREARLDRLGDLVADHLDTAALARLIEVGAPSLPPVSLTLGRADHGTAPPARLIDVTVGPPPPAGPAAAGVAPPVGGTSRAAREVAP